MIATEIYNGKSAEEIGICQVEFDSRRKTIDRFLLVWDTKDFDESYLQWLAGKYRSEEGIDDSEDCQVTAGEIASGLASSVKEILKSKIKVSTKEEQSRRYALCLSCKYITDKGKCKRCGCFMKIKTKFAAMKCPVGQW